MTYYFDSSAIAKLFLPEQESQAFRDFFEGTNEPRMRFSSRLAETELLRLAHRYDPDVVSKVQETLKSISLASVDGFTFKQAGSILPGTSLRTLDAIHLATATRFPDLEAIVTYDSRMIQSAESLGIKTLSPGSE